MLVFKTLLTLVLCLFFYFCLSSHIFLSDILLLTGPLVVSISFDFDLIVLYSDGYNMYF